MLEMIFIAPSLTLLPPLFVSFFSQLLHYTTPPHLSSQRQIIKTDISMGTLVLFYTVCHPRLVTFSLSIYPWFAKQRGDDFFCVSSSVETIINLRYSFMFITVISAFYSFPPLPHCSLRCCILSLCLSPCLCVCLGLHPCQVVFPDNRITILSLFVVSEPVGWIKHCIVNSAGVTSRKELEKL